MILSIFLTNSKLSDINLSQIFFMISVIIVTILGYSLFQSSSIIVPERPDNFTVLFRYGVESHNILNTTGGTFTKDMISDDPARDIAARAVGIYSEDRKRDQGTH